jgi:hypothetical protein
MDRPQAGNGTGDYDDESQSSYLGDRKGPGSLPSGMPLEKRPGITGSRGGSGTSPMARWRGFSREMNPVSRRYSHTAAKALYTRG